MRAIEPARRGRDRTGDVIIKRAYEAPEARDGTRVLVDRLWPRGLRKDKARIDIWMKEIAPSTELRRWFHQDPGRWKEFEKKYRTELRHNRDLVDQLRRLADGGTVTLLFAAHETDHNNATVLRSVLLSKRSTAKA